MSSLNRAYILKLWWKMIHQEDNLAIKAKYSKSNNMFRFFSYGSHLWKAMGKVWDIFKGNVLWGIGNGSNISLWEDRWVGEVSLRQLNFGPLNTGEDNLTVSSLLRNGAFDFSSLSFELPDYVSSLCRAVPLPVGTLDSEDFIFSNLATDGRFDFKKTLKIYKNSNQAPTNSWSWIWRGYSIPKIRFFLCGLLSMTDFLIERHSL